MTSSPLTLTRSAASGWLSKIGLLPVFLILTVIVVSLYEPRFLKTHNLINVLRNASFLSIVAAGQMLVIIVGGFDVSIGAVIALTSVSSALAMAGLAEWGVEGPVLITVYGCLIGIIPALLVGAVNGALVAYAKMSPFMVTIGTMSIAGGLATYVTGGIPIYDLPEFFTSEIGRGRVGKVPYVVFVAGLIIALLWYAQTQTRFGRYTYAVGGNAKASAVSGINTTFYTWSVYVVCAGLAGLVGLLLTARVGSGEATLGGSFMLESISAAVIGGVALKGGVGKVQAVALSAVFLATLSNGMNLARIDSKYHIIVTGLVILIAVGTEGFRGFKGAKS